MLVNLHFVWLILVTGFFRNFCTERAPGICADFLGALGANAPREKLQWVRCTQKNLDHKLNFSGIM